MTFFGLETPYKDALPHRAHAPDNTYVDPEYLFKNPFTVKVYPKYVHNSWFRLLLPRRKASARTFKKVGSIMSPSRLGQIHVASYTKGDP